MAAATRKIVNIEVATEAAAPSVRLADAHDVASPSPARSQQEALEALWAHEASLDLEPQRWSARRTFAFITLTCGGFWAAVILLAIHFLK